MAAGPVIVLGALGFIGRHVTEALERSGAPRVIGVSRRDGRSAGAVEHAPYDGVRIGRHLSGICDRVGAICLVNCVHASAGSKTWYREALDAAVGARLRWIECGSVAAYGDAAQSSRVTAFPEDVSLRPRSGYGRRKRSCEQWIADTRARDGDFEYTILRISTVLGPGASSPFVRRYTWFLRQGRVPIAAPADRLAVAVTSATRVGLSAAAAAAHPRLRPAYNVSDDVALIDFVSLLADRAGCRMPRYSIVSTRLQRSMELARKMVPGWPFTVERLRGFGTTARYPDELLEKDLGVYPDANYW